MPRARDTRHHFRVESLKGRLVVASPVLGDPNFDRTVVLMLEHNEEGALGLVLNRPSEVEVDQPLSDWRRFAAHPPVVFVGGPVSRESVIGLARLNDAGLGDRWQPVAPPTGVIDLTVDADEVGGAIDDVRIFSGYAGWAPEQLEGEIEEGAWFVVDTMPSDPFTAEPDNLWRVVLRRQPAPLSRYALYPPDPSLN
jgi:putative transcriptional regulator